MKDTYKIQIVRKLALILMAEHGLDDWTLEFDNARHRAGYCLYGPKRIQLSRPLMELWPIDECKDTIKHEIAHALNPIHGHDAEWRATCRRIGARPERCFDASTVEMLPPRWVGTCSKGHKIYRERITARARRSSCAKCSPVFNANNRFSWERNEVE